MRQYLYIGGMPEVVLSFSKNQDVQKAREIQQKILYAFEQDFSKHAPADIVPRIRMVWNAIPSQLAKENRKFIYGALKEGARAKEFEMALAWLVDSGLAYRVNRATKPAIPLIAYQDLNAFKLFMVDVGLLSAMGRIEAKTLIDGSQIFQEFKGALTEQFVCQQLIREKAFAVYYWSPQRSSAEVDFIIQYKDKVVPVEVKAEENLRSKSLKVYCDKYKPPLAIRTSMSDYRKETWFTNLPLYAIVKLLEL